MNISIHGVVARLAGIFFKLKVANRVAAVVQAQLNERTASAGAFCLFVDHASTMLQIGEGDRAGESKDQSAAALDLLFSHQSSEIKVWTDLITTGAEIVQTMGKDSPSRDMEPIRLTAGQQKVLKKLIEGKQNKIIAFERGLTEVAVFFYVRRICSRLGVKNRLAALRVVNEGGVVL